MTRGCMDMNLKDWTQCLEVNVYAPYRLAQLVVPTMRAHGSGSIINMVSAHGGPSSYAAAAPAIWRPMM